MTGKKGLSTVVTTLIIVLLVLAAIGIIWGPIRSLLTSSTSSLGGTACLELDVTATNVFNVSATNYSVTLRRGAGGMDSANVGAKLIFYSDTAVGSTIDFPAGATFGILDVKTDYVTTITDANQVEVVPYFIDENNEQRICTTSTTFNF